MRQVTRTPVPTELIDRAMSMLRKAIEKRLRHWGDGAFAGPHEAMGVLQEEVYEAWDAVRSNQAENLSAEMVDIGVAAVFTVASLWATERVSLPNASLTIAGDAP